MRIRFMNAGFRGMAAPSVYFAAKTVLALGLPALWFLYVTWSGLKLNTQALMATLLLAAAIGYYIPNVVLAQLVRLRKREIENLPDAIDLMTVCVEAGLGLDAAIVRVAEESAMASRALSEELHLVGLELRAGASREGHCATSRSHRRRGGRCAGGDARSGGSLRNQHRGFVARPLGQPSHQAPAPRRGSRREDSGQAGVSADLRHLSRHADRARGSGNNRDRARAASDDDWALNEREFR